MAAWKRCAKCNYIRHVNDDGRSRRDTCPMCGAVYEKAVVASAADERRRRSRSYLIDKTCGRCDEKVSSFARVCPHCKGPVRNLRRTFGYAIASGAVSVAIIGVAISIHRTPVSPFPGISDGRFAHCVAVSEKLSSSLADLGPAAVTTLRAQNEWHASCSRKALRLVSAAANTYLPTTPEGWLVAVTE